MTNIAEAFAWTERDAYRKYDELVSRASQFVEVSDKQTIDDDTKLLTNPHDLASYLRDEGYVLDHFEVLAIQEEAIMHGDAIRTDELDEAVQHVRQQLREAIEAKVRGWTDIDPAFLDDAVIDAALGFMRQVTRNHSDDVIGVANQHGRDSVIAEIYAMQRERQAEIPPDRPALQGVVEIAGIQQGDKG